MSTFQITSLKSLSSQWNDQDCQLLRIQIEEHLADLAFYTAVNDDHPFRRRAFKKVKANLYRFEALLPDYFLNNKLNLIPGVGKTIAAELKEFVLKGTSTRLDCLKTGSPLYLDQLKNSLNHADWLANLFRRQSFEHPLALFTAMESAWLTHQQLITTNQSNLLRNALMPLLIEYQSNLIMNHSVNWRNISLIHFAQSDWITESEKDILRSFESMATPIALEPLRLAQRSFHLKCLNISNLPRTDAEFNHICIHQFEGIFCSWMHPNFYNDHSRLELFPQIKCVMILLHPLLERFNAKLLKHIDSAIPIWFAALTPSIETYYLGYAQAFLDRFGNNSQKIINTLSKERLVSFLESLLKVS